VTLTVASGSTTSSPSTTQSSSSGTTATAPITKATAATFLEQPRRLGCGGSDRSSPLAGAAGVHSAASTGSGQLLCLAVRDRQRTCSGTLRSRACCNPRLLLSQHLRP
jgi:hypothetical protein